MVRPPKKQWSANNRQPPQPNSNTDNRPSKYRQFDSPTETIREGVIGALAKKYFNHLESRDNCKSKRGFVKDLLAGTNAEASGLEITHNDLNNEINRTNR